MSFKKLLAFVHYYFLRLIGYNGASICMHCGSYRVKIKNGKGRCCKCGAKFELKFTITSVPYSKNIQEIL